MGSKKSMWAYIHEMFTGENQPAQLEDDSKLMRSNTLLTKKEVYIPLCIAFTLAILFLINMLCSMFTHLGDMFRGTFESYLFFVPSFRFAVPYLFGLSVPAAISIFVVFKIKVNYGSLNVGQKGNSAFMTKTAFEKRVKAQL